MPFLGKAQHFFWAWNFAHGNTRSLGRVLAESSTGTNAKSPPRGGGLFMKNGPSRRDSSLNNQSFPTDRIHFKTGFESPACYLNTPDPICRKPNHEPGGRINPVQNRNPVTAGPHRIGLDYTGGSMPVFHGVNDFHA